MKADQSKNIVGRQTIQIILCLVLVIFIGVASFLLFFPKQNLIAGLMVHVPFFVQPTTVPTPTDIPPTSIPPTNTPTATSVPVYPQLDAVKVFNLINDYRAAHGLSRLAWDQDMCPFALKRLQQIHTDHSHSEFNAEVGKTYCRQCHHAGENLAGDVWTNEELVQGWIHSPSHLDDLMQPDFAVTCVAVDTVGPHSFAVQEFASNY